ncbi:MAG: transglutaminase domain-containing protein [Pseudomonadota bacterium]
MKRSKARIVLGAGLVCLCLAAVGFGLLLVVKQRHADPVYSIPRQVQYSFTLENRTSRLLKVAEFWTYAPVKETPTQRCTHVEASHAFRLLSDEWGNQILHFTLQDLPPYAARIITVRADLMLSETPNRVNAAALRPYLQPETYCESQDPEILKRAAELRAAKPEATAEKTFQWVAEHIRYSGYLKRPRGALYTLKTRSGDCTDSMYILAALLRANDIPARGLGGYVLKENGILKPGGYHNWVEFYEEGTWRIADPQKRNFAKTPSHYVAMRFIVRSPGNPMGDYDRFRSQGDGLTVRMNG